MTVRKFNCFLLHYWVKFNHLTNACGGGGGGLVARLCLTLGISQARRLKWVAISFARGSSQPRDCTRVSRIAGRRFNNIFKLLLLASKSLQLCPTLCDPMDCSLSGSSVHGIFQARVLEWIAISFARGSSQPRNRTRVSHIAGRRLAQ